MVGWGWEGGSICCSPTSFYVFPCLWLFMMLTFNVRMLKIPGNGDSLHVFCSFVDIRYTVLQVHESVGHCTLHGVGSIWSWEKHQAREVAHKTDFLGENIAALNKGKHCSWLFLCPFESLVCQTFYTVFLSQVDKLPFLSRSWRKYALCWNTCVYAGWFETPKKKKTMKSGDKFSFCIFLKSRCEKAQTVRPHELTINLMLLWQRQAVGNDQSCSRACLSRGHWKRDLSVNAVVHGCLYTREGHTSECRAHE